MIVYACVGASCVHSVGFSLPVCACDVQERPPTGPALLPLHHGASPLRPVPHDPQQPCRCTHSLTHIRRKPCSQPIILLIAPVRANISLTLSNKQRTSLGAQWQLWYEQRLCRSEWNCLHLDVTSTHTTYLNIAADREPLSMHLSI